MELGSSLFAPNVQELAKQSLADVPDRYLRKEQDPQSDVSVINQTLPVIDLHDLTSPESIVSELELERLHSACKEWGFFQVVKHGVDISLLEKVKSEIQGFFNLPMDEKKKFWQEEGDLEGFGQVFIQSEDQKLNWGDMFYVRTLPEHMRKAWLLPKLPLPLRETIESYSSEMSKLCTTLFELMGKALKIDARIMADLLEDGRQSIRMNYYPPCHQPENVLGIEPHSDLSILTMLLQLNEVEGLQVRKENIWVPIKPLPNAIIVNIGDILEITSNGIYRSVEHRVTVNSAKERLSVATFQNPKLKSEIGPVHSLITTETPALFRSVRYEDYLRNYFARAPDGKSRLDYMRIGQGDEDTNI
ncbi:hypothetical protein MKW94_014419 [Papaver nudicaule]|uniref:Fe2OG dioxygenase domain-containing protein n=1 Tax=Papaver nudicaule TaxID=74823 RepID=A0AA42B4N9_PAPNU|nr:hypothetical protein [Papaver nudicaule]